MGLSGEQLDQLRPFAAFQSTIWWWTLVFTGFAIGYMLWVKKYFAPAR
jgi:hypothetical protein